jgi:hypothetical protein
MQNLHTIIYLQVLIFTLYSPAEPLTIVHISSVQLTIHVADGIEV